MSTLERQLNSGSRLRGGCSAEALVLRHGECSRQVARSEVKGQARQSSKDVAKRIPDLAAASIWTFIVSDIKR